VKASIEDILNMFETLDESCSRDVLPTFCAANKDRVPQPKTICQTVQLYPEE